MIFVGHGSCIITELY